MLGGFGKRDDERVYRTLLDSLRELGVECEPEPDDMSVAFIVQGDDLEIGFHAKVLEGCVLLSAVLAVTVPPERQDEVLWRINALNADSMFGHFVLHPDEGMITFDHSYLFEDRPSGEHLQFLVYSMLKEVDDVDGELSGLLEEDDRMSLYH